MNFAAKGEVLSYTECDHAVPITGQKILMLALSKIIPKTECTQVHYVSIYFFKDELEAQTTCGA